MKISLVITLETKTELNPLPRQQIEQEIYDHAADSFRNHRWDGIIKIDDIENYLRESAKSADQK